MGGKDSFPRKKKREKERRQRERHTQRDGNERLREMTREQAKKKGASIVYKAQVKTIPHSPSPRGNPELESLNKGGGCGEMPGTLLRNE